MKLLLLLFSALVSVAMAQPTILISWDRWADPEQESSRGAFFFLGPDLDGTVRWGGDAVGRGQWLSGGFGGSNDGSYGSESDQADTAKQGVQAIRTGVEASGSTWIELTVENNSMRDFRITGIHLDLWRSFGGSASHFQWEILEGGGLSPVAPDEEIAITAQGRLPDVESGGDYEDFDLSLEGLADNTLAVGETAVFRFYFPSDKGNLFIDNVALSIAD